MSIRRRLSLVPLITVMTITVQAYAETAQERGFNIFKAQEDKDAGWKSSKVSGKMILLDAAGKATERNFDALTLERNTATEGDLARILFLDPADVRGTALLSHSKAEPADDDQWLYMPANRRVRRIASANRSGKFLSSEFAYEDMSGEELEDNSYEWLEQVPCPDDPNQTCDSVAVTPKNAASGYSKRITKIDTTERRIHQVEYFNRNNTLEKRLTFSGYKNIQGHWRPSLLSMQNLLTGRKTEIHWGTFTFDVKPSEQDFSPEQLGK